MNRIIQKFVVVSIVFFFANLFSVVLKAQANQQELPDYTLHSFGLKVSDVETSLMFYQSLFDAPLLHRDGSTAYLGLGSDNAFMSLSEKAEGEAASITHIGIALKDFNGDTLEKKLSENGLKKSDVSNRDWSGLNSAMSYSDARVPKKEIVFYDYEGVQFKLLATDYCVDESNTAASCDLEDDANDNAPMSLLGINHFTTFVANFERANVFYRRFLEIENHTFQGSFPTLGVGDGYQFLMFVGGVQQGAPTAAANIHHVSLAVDDFDVEKIQSILNSKGLSFVGNGNGVVPPLSHYVSLRMPERGGAEAGTPELYFTDPDGLRIQLQDISYCGGGGYLGNECQ